VSSQIDVGVIGGGLVAQAVHLPNLAALHSRFRLAALADPSAKVRTTVAARFGIPTTYRSAEELLEHKGLGGVIVCSPNARHSTDVLQALAQGLHVFVEKPLCIAPQDADLIAAGQARSGRVVQVGYMKRFDRSFEHLLDLIGKEGECDIIHALTHEPPVSCLHGIDDVVVADDLAQADRRALQNLRDSQVRKAVGADDPQAAFAFSEIFLGSVIHDLNLVSAILEQIGDRVSVAGTLAVSWAAGRGAHVVTRTLRDRRCVLTWCETGGSFDEQITVLTSRGRHELRFMRPFTERSVSTLSSYVAGELRIYERHHRASDPFRAQLKHFHDCVVANAQCRTPASQGRRDIEVLAAAFAGGPARRSEPI
jgi:predicted dehydrogenase